MVTVLFLAANPLDTPQLRLDEEARAIDAALHHARFAEQFALYSHWAVRVADLIALLQRRRPQIVHFCGHGNGAGEIQLQDEDGRAVSTPSAALSQLFKLFARDVRCVVLNACYMESQAAAIAEHVRCVVGTSDAVSDDAACSFASAFYAALADGSDVQRSFDLGCVQIALHGLLDGTTPVLHSNGNPKRRRFARSPRKSGAADAVPPAEPRAGGVNFTNAKVIVTGDIVGRDKNVGILPHSEPKEDLL
jgi:hypothetical protein